VDEEEVDVIDPQLRERLDERVPHGLAFGRLEQLRRDEQELAGFPRRCDARAQRLLVLVYLCAIECAVPVPNANKGIVVLSFNLIGVFAILDDENYRLATRQGGLS